MKNIKTIVFESVGHASMCWSETPKGVFDEQEANVVGNKLMDEINAYAARLLEWAAKEDFVLINTTEKILWCRKAESISYNSSEIIQEFNELESKKGGEG